MNNEEKITPSIYHIEWFDNGITLTQPEEEIYELEKFSNGGKHNDEAMHKFLGKMLWEDIHYACDSLLCNKFKVTIKIENDE